MNTTMMKTALLLAASLAGGASILGQQSGGAFQVTRSTTASGGGRSTGGVFAVTGTLGQPAAGVASGGAFSVRSGFWSVVQTPGAPILHITSNGAGGAVVSWPAPSTGWVLQQTTALASQPALTVWTDVTSPPVVVAGSENTVTFTAATGIRYFRLVNR